MSSWKIELIQCSTIDTATVLGSVNAIYFTGAAVASIAQCYLADWLGRRKALAIAAIMGIIGSALVAGSVTIGMLIAVRVLQGAGLGMLLTLVPLYLSEIAPPHRRGFLTGLTVLSFGTGYVMCVPLIRELTWRLKTNYIDTARVGQQLPVTMPRT